MSGVRREACRQGALKSQDSTKTNLKASASQLMIVAIHIHQGNKVVCVTDAEHIGKKYAEGEKRLNITKEFYGGKEVSKEAIKPLLNDAYVVHFTGKQSVAFGIELNLIRAGKIVTIAGVPHAQVVVERD